MRTGPLLLIRNHPDRPQPLTRLYAEAIEDCVLAEDLGFDLCFLAEHHFTTDDWAPSPLTLLAAMAARTERIRLGTGVLQLALHNPVRIAEDVASVDLISSGRFELAVGIGSIPREYEVLGIDAATRSGRLFEALAVIERCFYEDGPFDHEGRHFSYRGLEITARPAQGMLPIWFGGSGPKNVARAARRGYHLMSVSPGYDQALRDAGRDLSTHRVGLPHFVHLAPSHDQAWDEAQEGLHWTCSFYRRAGVEGWGGSTAEGYLPRLPDAERLREVPGLGLVPGSPFLVGTPDEVCELLRPLLDGALGRITDIPITFRHAGMPSDQVHRSMTLFAAEVLPFIYERATGAAPPRAQSAQGVGDVPRC